MYQFNNLTSNVPNIQTYNGNGGAWETWTKPNDAILIHILCIGGGGGGGSGRKDSAATARFGGGGGGSSAVTSMFVPAFLIPDTLYVQVGLGGAGGAAQTVNATDGNAGTGGGTSYVALYPSYTGIGQRGNLLVQSTYGPGAGGGGGGTATTGAGGAFASAFQPNNTSFYVGLGQFTSTAGQAGSSSSATVEPTALTISGITCGGAAGGGVSSSLSIAINGGAINSPSALIPYLTSLAGGLRSSIAITNNGYAVKKPLMWVGGVGSGGSTSNAQSVPTAGSGAIGSGGGGGGASNGGSGGVTNSGAGGNGGDGIVIITSYSI